MSAPRLSVRFWYGSHTAALRGFSTASFRPRELHALPILLSTGHVAALARPATCLSLVPAFSRGGLGPDQHFPTSVYDITVSRKEQGLGLIFALKAYRPPRVFPGEVWCEN